MKRALTTAMPTATWTASFLERTTRLAAFKSYPSSTSLNAAASQRPRTPACHTSSYECKKVPDKDHARYRAPSRRPRPTTRLCGSLKRLAREKQHLIVHCTHNFHQVTHTFIKSFSCPFIATCFGTEIYFEHRRILVLASTLQTHIVNPKKVAPLCKPGKLHSSKLHSPKQTRTSHNTPHINLAPPTHYTGRLV
jgi:hypothetical protein